MCQRTKRMRNNDNEISNLMCKFSPDTKKTKSLNAHQEQNKNTIDERVFLCLVCLKSASVLLSPLLNDCKYK